jgi:hypothetical protein
MRVVFHTFWLSPEWYLIKGDPHAPEEAIVFRQYGFGPLSQDLVNVHMYVCQLRHKNHLTIRIPKEYRLQGISSDSWFPETSVHAKTHASTYEFSGEVTVTKGDTEVFVDSDEVRDKDFSKIFDSKTLAWAIGPEHAQVKITYVQDGKSLNIVLRRLASKTLKAENMDLQNALDRCAQYKGIVTSGTEQNPRSWKPSIEVDTGGSQTLSLSPSDLTFHEKADCFAELKGLEKAAREVGFEKVVALCIPSCPGSALIGQNRRNEGGRISGSS